MAKKFGKTKQEVEEVELEPEDAVEEDVEEEDEIEEPEPPKKVVRRAKVVEEVEEEVEEDVEDEVEDEIEAEEKPAKRKKKATEAKGAPRARKWNYGIQDDSVISRVKDGECPSSVEEQWDYAKTGTTVAAFTKAGGDRHGLRVMMRAGAIKLKTDGETYPQAWDPSDAKRPAKKAEVVEEEPAPAPKKRVAKKK